MDRKVLGSIAVLILAALACSTLSVGTNRVTGSGKIASESRNVSGFTAVELAGSADVTVTVGKADSVTVEADDNIVPLIETRVSNGKLFISTKPGTDLLTSNGVHVTVMMQSLNGLTLSGSGKMDISGMSGPQLALDLPGSGDLTVTGTADHVSISLLGSGNVVCNGLKAHTADVTLLGSGNITVYADQSLDAKLSGSGNIRYEGNPPQVTKSITGSGNITP